MGGSAGGTDPACAGGSYRDLVTLNVYARFVEGDNAATERVKKNCLCQSLRYRSSHAKSVGGII